MIDKIAIFGPQGSGKGTQAELLAKKLDIDSVSTGNIFRQEIKEKTPFGKKIQINILLGHLVPDKLTIEIVSQKIQDILSRNRGFILDGFPRNKKQMLALQKITELTHVLVIEISDEEAVRRISQRLVCVCGKTYHLKFNPPKNDSLCDECGRQLFVREDDKPHSVKKRLEIYHKATEPLYEYYGKLGILARIDGEQSIQKVYEDIMKVL